jgi:hypothetical protein
MNKKVAITVSVIALLAIAAAAYWIILPNLNLNDSQNSGKTDDGSAVAVVCDEFYVDRYNEASSDMLRDGGAPGSDSYADLTELLGEIRSKDGHQEDLTCQNIVFLAELDLLNHEGAKSASESIKKLESEGARVDESEFSSYYPPSEHEYMLDTISDEEDTTGAARGD